MREWSESNFHSSTCTQGGSCYTFLVDTVILIITPERSRRDRRRQVKVTMAPSPNSIHSGFTFRSSLTHFTSRMSSAQWMQSSEIMMVSLPDLIYAYRSLYQRSTILLILVRRLQASAVMILAAMVGHGQPGRDFNFIMVRMSCFHCIPYNLLVRCVRPKLSLFASSSVIPISHKVFLFRYPKHKCGAYCILPFLAYLRNEK